MLIKGPKGHPTEPKGPGFESASLHAGERLALVIPSPDPTHVGATSTGSVLLGVLIKLRVQLIIGLVNTETYSDISFVCSFRCKCRNWAASEASEATQQVHSRQ